MATPKLVCPEGWALDVQTGTCLGPPCLCTSSDPPVDAHGYPCLNGATPANFHSVYDLTSGTVACIGECETRPGVVATLGPSSVACQRAAVSASTEPGPPVAGIALLALGGLSVVVALARSSGRGRRRV